MTRVLIIGLGAAVHVGAHLLSAAQSLGVEADLLDVTSAYEAPRWLAQINWRLRGHRPTHLDAFSDQVLRRCAEYQPQVVIVTGIIPPSAAALAALRAQGIRCVNYLTDDPWNRQHHTPWFFAALPHYAHIYSPRTSNLADLARAGCSASYLPFAYNPAVHYVEPPPPAVAAQYQCDVLFYGGADADRLPAIEALIRAGFQIHLYGGYWDRSASTRAAYRGIANAQSLRWAASGARVTLCLVRRANRDGHVMRTFEAPALGACLLAEDTAEHHDLLDDTVPYFDSTDSLIAQTRKLLDQPAARADYRRRAMERITGGGNTYTDRLRAILSEQA